ISGLSPSTTYEYHIRTQCDNSGYSPYSTIQTFTTSPLKVGDVEQENNISSFTLKPNPAKDQLIISFETDAKTLNYQIINSSGQIVLNDILNVVHENLIKTIHINKLHSGFYLIRVFNANNIANRIFVKE